jgi:hypothetical protein
LAGARLVVPRKDPSDKTDLVRIFAAVAQILASTVAIIVVTTT